MADARYELVDSGEGRKLERFGPYVIDRPCAQAIWRRSLSGADWRRADAVFLRENSSGWHRHSSLPATWTIELDGLTFEVMLTDFGHLGVFPEHVQAWRWAEEQIRRTTGRVGQTPSVLNLFAYTGGTTLAAARRGASVCHLDASKKSVQWARRNATLNRLSEAPVRWVVDDVRKFLRREVRRGRRYDAVVLDPPSFGRGSRHEVFKIGSDLTEVLSLCREVLTTAPAFVFLSCHTPELRPLALQHLLGQTMAGIPGALESGDLALMGGEGALTIPSGTYAAWTGPVAQETA